MAAACQQFLGMELDQIDHVAMVREYALTSLLLLLLITRSRVKQVGILSLAKFLVIIKHNRLLSITDALSD